MRLSSPALALTLALGPAAVAAEDDALRSAHEAVRTALLEHATLPTRPPSLPDGATMTDPRVRADHARRAEAEREAHERAVRRGEQHRAHHMDRDHGSAEGPRRGGMQGVDSAGECAEAAGAVRTREMHGGMDGGHTGGGADGGPHMDGR
jgi:hypothetical protein